jgi:hypothetical protein
MTRWLTMPTQRDATVPGCISITTGLHLRRRHRVQGCAMTGAEFHGWMACNSAWRQVCRHHILHPACKIADVMGPTTSMLVLAHGHLSHADETSRHEANSELATVWQNIRGMGSGPWALWLWLLIIMPLVSHMVTNHKSAMSHIDFALPCAVKLCCAIWCWCADTSPQHHSPYQVFRSVCCQSREGSVAKTYSQQKLDSEFDDPHAMS